MNMFVVSINVLYYCLTPSENSSVGTRFILEGYSFKYTEGNNVSDRVARIDLVIDIYWRVGLQKAYCPFRFNLSSFFLVNRFT
jgi:hypothetical protein